MITGAQVKAARKLLGWSVNGLAARAFLSTTVVLKIEAGSLPIAPSAAANLCRCLTAAGIEFGTESGPGVRLVKR